MKAQHDDERLAMLEMMIENGQVFEQYNKKDKVLKERVPKTARVYSVERKKKVSVDQLKEAIQDFVSWDDIGALLGVSGTCARKRAKALGLEKKSFIGRTTEVSDDEIREAIQDHLSWGEIGQSLGVSGNFVRLRAMALGIEKQRAPRAKGTNKP